MFKIFFFMMLLAHVIGDFYLQSDRPVGQKGTSAASFLKQGAVYAAVCLVLAVPAFSAEILLAYAVLAGSHLLIDFILFLYIRKMIPGAHADPNMERRIYIIDQTAHMLAIAGIAFEMTASGQIPHFMPWVHSFFHVVGIPASPVLLWTLALLMIYKPVNSTIKKLIASRKPQENGGSEGRRRYDEIRVGGFIGLLERLTILVFLSLGQYSAIGLVLTAKSIARYKKISEEQTFAEYYLLGTLLSTISVIVIYLLLF